MTGNMQHVATQLGGASDRFLEMLLVDRIDEPGVDAEQLGQVIGEWAIQLFGIEILRPARFDNEYLRFLNQCSFPYPGSVTAELR